MIDFHSLLRCYAISFADGQLSPITLMPLFSLPLMIT